MRKYIFISLVFSLLFVGESLVVAQTIGLRMPDTTVMQGNIIDMPVYVDSTLTGQNVTSYLIQVGFDPYYFQAVSAVTTGTISNQLGAATVNTAVAGKVTVAAAGTTALTGVGKFVIIRLKVVHSGWTVLSFTDAQHNYFNEGSPAVTLESADISIQAKPTITVNPDNALLAKGYELQMYAYNGVEPYQWSVTNPAVASIDANGMLTALQAGKTKVVAQDANGIIDTTDNDIEIRALKLTIADTLSQWQGAFIDVPIITTSLTGLNITSGVFKVSMDTGIMKPIGIIQAGTLLALYNAPVINISSAGQINIAFAGTTPLVGSGTLLYVRCLVSSLRTGTTSVSISDILFNQDILASNDDGYFTTKSFALIYITPINGYLIAGESQQFNVEGDGIPPYAWSVNDTAIAIIDQTGLMTAKRSGVVIVSVEDSVGATDNSEEFYVYDTKIIMPDTVICTKPSLFSYPVFIQSLPEGQSISSIEANITYDTAYLNLTEIETTSTLTDGWSFALNPSSGKLAIAGSGFTSFNTAGTIFNLKFVLKPGFDFGLTAHFNLNDVTVNEGTPLPYVDVAGGIKIENAAIAGSITGADVVCQGQQNVWYNVPYIEQAVSYGWNIPVGASIISGDGTNTIYINFSDTAKSGNISAYAVTGCGNGAPSPDFSVTVNALPNNISVISGEDTVCQGQVSVIYSVGEISDAINYYWSLPSGASGSSSTNTITVDFDNWSAVSGDISVYAENTCGYGVESKLSVNVNPLPQQAGQIDGLQFACQGQSGVVYTVTAIPNATSYVWTLPQGAFGANGSNITDINYIEVNFSDTAKNGDVNVFGRNSCGDGGMSAYGVVVNPRPLNADTIYGDTLICPGQTTVTYTVPEIPYANTYLWSLPSGATGVSTTNSINVDFDMLATSGDITVKGVNDCGEGQVFTLNIKISSLPAKADTIIGDTIVCQSQDSVVYSVPMIANATSYLWTLPSGATGVSSTNSIVVDFASNAISGIIGVKGQNDCGDGSQFLINVLVKALPAIAENISGLSTVCQGQDSVVYSVPLIDNAVSYIWTLPTGASGVSITNSLSVDYSLISQSGDITVKGQNTCGMGEISTLSIVVNDKPVTPVISYNENVLHSDASNGNQWYNSNGIIDGATSQDYNVTEIGDYYVVVTLSECSSDKSNLIHVEPTAIKYVITEGKLQIYPNPFSDELNVEVREKDEMINYEITNSIGQVVISGGFMNKIMISTLNLPKGIYVLKVNIGNAVVYWKLILE